MSRAAAYGLSAAILFSLGCFSDVSARTASRVDADRSHGLEADPLEMIQQAMNGEKDIAVRVYYASKGCSVRYGNVPFPRVKMRNFPPTGSTLEKLQTLFKGDKSVRVVKTGDGVIEIDVGNVSRKVLNTQLGTVNFGEDERYNAALAMISIEADESIRKLIIPGGPPEVISIGVELSPPETNPHLPNSITGFNLEQALTLISHTFNEVVYYGSCDKSKIFKFWLY